MGRSRSRWMTQRIFLNIGGPLIPYWCPGFETPLNHLSAQDLTCRDRTVTYEMIFRDRFSLVNGSRIQQIKLNLAECRQK